MQEPNTIIDKPKDVSAILWLGLPLVTLAICWLSPLLLQPPTWSRHIMGEGGYIENASVAMLLAAVVMCVLLLTRRRMPRVMKVLIVLLGVASLFLAGEEASWGQHWFGFETSEGLARINNQRETNLHNIKGTMQESFTEDGRRLISKFCIIGGVVLPLCLLPWRKKLAERQSIWNWLVPTWRLIPLALCVGAIKNIAHVAKKLFNDPPRGSIEWMVFIRPAGELKEHLFEMLILMYTVSLFVRLPRKTQPPAAPAAPAGERA